MGAEMTKDEALKLALEALEFYYDLYKEKVDANVITAIKEALAQPKQKPVAWMREDEDCTDCIVWEQTEEHTIPLYTAPPQREPLTDEEFSNLVVENLGPHALTGGKMSVYDAFLIAVRATEAAHGIKE